jgi:hypothetical protein
MIDMGLSKPEDYTPSAEDYKKLSEALASIFPYKDSNGS